MRLIDADMLTDWLLQEIRAKDGAFSGMLGRQAANMIGKKIDETPTVGEWGGRTMPNKSAWTDDLTSVPYMRTVFLELTRDDGYMAYGVGYMDMDGAFNVVCDDDEFSVGEDARWNVVRWLDPTRA